MVTHNLHGGETKWLDPDRLADGSAGCFGFSFKVRRRKTPDGYTRLEGRIGGEVDLDESGSHIFTVYLSDRERREMADALLAGLD